MERSARRQDRQPGLEVPWSGLALALALIAAGSLGTLAVVVSVKDVDTLSTIALALAVLAFAAQLIVSLVQAQGSAQQIAQTERINAQTQSTLVEVRSTAQAVLTNQSGQFDKVLSAALHSATESVAQEVASAASESEGQDADSSQPVFDADIIAEKLERRIRRAIVQTPTDSNVTSKMSGAFGPPIDDAQSATQALELLSSLQSFELVVAMSRMNMAAKRGRLGSISTPSMMEINEGLTRAGFYRRVDLESARYIYVPTDAAKLLARMLFNVSARQGWYKSILSGHFHLMRANNGSMKVYVDDQTDHPGEALESLRGSEGGSADVEDTNTPQDKALADENLENS